jgi:hypothetical protein
MEIKEETINKLEEMQNSFYRSLMNVPYTTPKPALIWEVGGLKMKFRIMMTKLLFMHHGLSLESSTLAKQIQKVQQRNDLPGLTKEVQTLISELELPNLFSEKMKKSKWKNLVKKAIFKANENEIRQAIQPYKKMADLGIEEDKFECKDYLSTLPLSKARTLFNHKYKMTENVQMNYKNDSTFANDLWKCSKCLNQDTEAHLLWCPGYQDMRQGLDLADNHDLCSYLQKIFILRCNEEKG